MSTHSNRRQFTQIMGAAAAVPSTRYFYFAIIADTHIIDGKSLPGRRLLP